MMQERTKYNSLWRYAVAALVVANLLVWAAIYDTSQRTALTVEFFDVGQGDAALILTPAGGEILIDGGPDSSILARLGGALPFWDRDIDLVVLTHPDHDHIAGLLEVLKNYRVKNIMWTGAGKDTAEFHEWLRLVSEEHANVVYASKGTEVTLDASPDHLINILYPYNDISGSTPKDSNDASMVMKLTYGARSFLFAGDVGKGVEDGLALEGDLKADVLKVAHHGSKYAASDAFLARVLPASAVISVGENNPYGHPGPATLEMLANYGIKVFRTDVDGNITFETDGQRIFVKSQK